MDSRAPRERRTLDHSDSIPPLHESCSHDCSARGPCWTYLCSAQDHQASRPRHAATCSRYCQAGEDVHPLCYALAAGPSMPYWGQARDTQLESVAVIVAVVRSRRKSQPALPSFQLIRGPSCLYTAAGPLRALLSGYTNTRARPAVCETPHQDGRPQTRRPGGLSPCHSYLPQPLRSHRALKHAFYHRHTVPDIRCHMVQAVVSVHMATGD
jgi:hypothetical protein